MYSEKIAYAHKCVLLSIHSPRRATRADSLHPRNRFVPQANRALRPFNIYLNTRHRSRLSLARLFGSASAPPPSSGTALSRTSSGASSSSSTASPPPPLSRRTSASSLASAASSSTTSSLRSSGAFRSPPVSPPLSPSASPPSSPSSRPSPLPVLDPSDPVTQALPPPARPPSSTGTPGGIPLPPIPPAQNPRGELIFSSRVSGAFREGYERYRAEWERRRAEAKRVQRERERAGQGWRGVVRRAWGVRDPVQVREGKDKGKGEKGLLQAPLGRRAPPAQLVQDDAREPRSRESSARSVASSASSTTSSIDASRTADGARSSSASHEPDRSTSSSTSPSRSTSSRRSTPSSSRSASPRRLSLSPLTAPPSPPAAAARANDPSPSRIRAESFSDLLHFDARSESGALRPPGLERSNSMRGGG